MDSDFIEKNCSIELGGKVFSAGGAYIAGDRGLVYIVRQNTSMDGKSYQWRATTWAGVDLGNALETGEWRGRYGYLWRSYHVRINGQWWIGRHCADSGDMLRIRREKQS